MYKYFIENRKTITLLQIFIFYEVNLSAKYICICINYTMFSIYLQIFIFFTSHSYMVHKYICIYGICERMNENSNSETQKNHRTWLIFMHWSTCFYDHSIHIEVYLFFYFFYNIWRYLFVYIFSLESVHFIWIYIHIYIVNILYV